MKPWTILLAFVFLVFAASATALAGPPTTGTTALLADPVVSGTAVDVDVSVVSDIPVVPYEYAIQNECFFDGKPSGPPDSFQRDDIVNWNFSDSTGTIPHAIMTVYLNTVPADSVCKVFLVKNNQVVKGSTTTYDVE